MPATLPVVDESRRLADLESLEILDTPPEAAFDRITRRLGEIFDVPVSSIAFIDADTQFYKSRVLPPGWEDYPRVIPRHTSICAHVVGENHPLVIEDLAAHPDFAAHPAVTQYGLRFYAGTPLRADSGRAVGSLCIMDDKPRHLSKAEQGMLHLLAEEVMTEIKLRAATQKLARRTRVIEQDLARARVVQQYLLPPTQVAAGPFMVSRLYHPHDQLGGDFLDVLVRADGSAVVLIADVAGHGAGAALTAAMTKAAFLRRAPRADSPEALLASLNSDLFSASPQSQFMTALAGILLPERRELRLAGAGHPSPIHLQGTAARVLDRLPGGIPLLIDQDATYDGHVAVALAPGDRLVLYTDGATEAADGDRQRLEPEGLARLAVGASQGHSGQAFLNALLTAVSEYANHDLTDDIALVGVEVGG